MSSPAVVAPKRGVAAVGSNVGESSSVAAVTALLQPWRECRQRLVIASVVSSSGSVSTHGATRLCKQGVGGQHVCFSPFCASRLQMVFQSLRTAIKRVLDEHDSQSTCVR